MPVHDWTCVRPGTFHHFHTSWITHLSEALNGGILPTGFFAKSEQPAGEVGPDVLTLEATSDADNGLHRDEFRDAGLTAVAERPPQVSFTVTAEMAVCAAKRRSLVIRHATGDRVVALIEIISPGNKTKRSALEAFLDKAVSALRHGYHLVVIDLFPPGPCDPTGIHGAIWSEIEDSSYRQPVAQPLTLAAYSAGVVPTAYVEPLAVGAVLPVVPLFLDPEWYVDVPLEETYLAAWQGMPERWKNVLEMSSDTQNL